MNNAMQSLLYGLGVYCICGCHHSPVLQRESGDEKIIKRRSKP